MYFIVEYGSISIKQCVAVDAVVEDDLISALKVSVFPEIIFTKAGRILYREKGISFLKLIVFVFHLVVNIYDLNMLIYWLSRHPNCR